MTYSVTFCYRGRSGLFHVKRPACGINDEQAPFELADCSGASGPRGHGGGPARATFMSGYIFRMASKSEIVIRVTATRGATRIQYTTKGRYVSFTTAGYNRDLARQPIQPTSSLKAYWLSVLNVVLADITANG